MDNDIKQLLRDIKDGMRETAELVDGEWGAGFTYDELLKSRPSHFHQHDLYLRVCAALGETP